MKILLYAVLLMMAITMTNYCYHPSQKVGSNEIAVAVQQGQKQVLENEYSNKYFSLKYPSTWQIYQENTQLTAQTTIQLQII